MLASALLLSAFLATAPDAGTAPPDSKAVDTIHPLLQALKESLEFCFDTEAAQQRVAAVSLEGTGNGDYRALSLKALDFTIRRQGPKVLRGIVKAKLWPQGQDTRIIQRVERLPPFRHGSDPDPRLTEDLFRLAEAVSEVVEQRPPLRTESEDKWTPVAYSVGAMADSMSRSQTVLVPENDRGDPALMLYAANMVGARVVMEGETKAVVDTAVGLLNELVKVARKGTPRVP
jgi:hypothetical protein